MFRTRDFLFIFSAIAFLLAAIGGTLFSRLDTYEQTASVIEFVTDTREEFSAEIYQPETVSREDRIASMRQKIAASDSLPLLAVEIVPASSEVAATDEVDEVVQPVATSLSKCSHYFTYQGVWTPQEIKSSVAEGARVYYRESSPLALAETVIQQEVVLQLSLHPISNSQPSCLSSDVIGIAQDGSLIRHNESGLYSVFGENTLIGYALDGFPIYGVSSVATDECGGAVVAGEYRYHLSETRDSVLHCFRATPASL